MKIYFVLLTEEGGGLAGGGPGGPCPPPPSSAQNFRKIGGAKIPKCDKFWARY